MSGPFCGACGRTRAAHPHPGCAAFQAARGGERVRVHTFEVDDGDGSGAEQRADLFLAHNGEHGSGGALRRMMLEDLRAVAGAVAQLVEGMEQFNRGGGKP